MTLLNLLFWVSYDLVPGELFRTLWPSCYSYRIQVLKVVMVWVYLEVQAPAQTQTRRDPRRLVSSVVSQKLCQMMMPQMFMRRIWAVCWHHGEGIIVVELEVRIHILAHQIRLSEILPGLENLILPMLSYPGCHVRATYIGCIGTHANGRQVTSLLR